MLGFQGGVSIPLVKGGVKAPPAKRQCRAGPKAGARRGFTQCTLAGNHPHGNAEGACGAVSHFACEALWGMLLPHNLWRSYWIPGSYVPTLSKHRHSFLTLLKNKGSQEERRTKVGLLRHRQLH